MRVFGHRMHRQHAIAVVLTLMVALAGCSGATGGDDGPDLEPTDATAAGIIENASTELESIETYRLSATLESTVSSANGEQTIQVIQNASVDRANQRIRTVQETTANGQTVTAESYIVDGTVYQNSEALVQMFNSEWIKVNVSESLQERFNQNDELGAHLVMLENASVTVEGIQELDTGDAYRLQADVNESALEAFYGFDETSISVESLNTTVWVDTETDRIVRTNGTIVQSVEVQGQEAETTLDYEETFRYTDVNVTLPDAASSAVDVNQTSNPFGV